MSTTATATHYAKLIPHHSLLHVGEQGAVGPHHLLDRAHPDLPDPLTQLGAVSRTSNSKEKIAKLGHLNI